MPASVREWVPRRVRRGGRPVWCRACVTVSALRSAGTVERTLWVRA